MFGKFFASTFTGSMMAAGADIFSVWGYVVAHTIDSRVELNPKLLAAVIGSSTDKMLAAIEYLCAPDPDSRSKEHDGRRLIREGEYQYFVPNHVKYRSIRDEADRREYNRVKKQEERARKSNGVKRSVNDSQRQSKMSAQAEAEAEAEAKKEKKDNNAPKRSVESRGTRIPDDWKPSADDCAFASDLGLDPILTRDEFVDYWATVPGKGGRKLDWSKTFRNRCRELGTRPRARASSRGAGPGNF